MSTPLRRIPALTILAVLAGALSLGSCQDVASPDSDSAEEAPGLDVALQSSTTGSSQAGVQGCIPRSEADHLASTESELRTALQSAGSGDVIGITAMIPVDDPVFVRTDGVTLTCAGSGNAGQAGLDATPDIQSGGFVAIPAEDVTVHDLVIEAHDENGEHAAQAIISLNQTDASPHATDLVVRHNRIRCGWLDCVELGGVDGATVEENVLDGRPSSAATLVVRTVDPNFTPSRIDELLVAGNEIHCGSGPACLRVFGADGVTIRGNSIEGGSADRILRAQPTEREPLVDELRLVDNVIQCPDSDGPCFEVSDELFRASGRGDGVSFAFLDNRIDDGHPHHPPSPPWDYGLKAINEGDPVTARISGNDWTCPGLSCFSLAGHSGTIDSNELHGTRYTSWGLSAAFLSEDSMQIRNNRIQGQQVVGMLIHGLDRAVITGNVLRQEGGCCGIHVQARSERLRIVGNEVVQTGSPGSSVWAGIRLNGGAHHQLRDNVIRGDWSNGITITGMDSSTVEEVDIRGVQNYGVHYWHPQDRITSYRSRFRSLDMADIGGAGYFVNGACANRFEDVDFSGASHDTAAVFSDSTGGNHFDNRDRHLVIDRGGVDCDSDPGVDPNVVEGPVRKGAAVGASTGSAAALGTGALELVEGLRPEAQLPIEIR